MSFPQKSYPEIHTLGEEKVETKTCRACEAPLIPSGVAGVLRCLSCGDYYCYCGGKLIPFGDRAATCNYCEKFYSISLPLA